MIKTLLKIIINSSQFLKYLKVAYVNDINYILSWESRGLNEIKIESIKTNNHLLNPGIDHYGMSKIGTKFDGSFLNRFPPTILHGNIVKIYIVYEITSNYNGINYPALENCLFGSLKLTKNTDIHKYGNMDITDMVLDLIERHHFQLVMKLVKMQ